MAADIRGVIFDLGNTLIHFEGFRPEVIQEADQQLLDHLVEEGLEVDPQPFLARFREKVNQYYDEREAEFIEYTTNYILRVVLEELGYKDVEESLLSPALKSHYKVFQAYWKPEEDAKPTLKQLQKEGYKLGIVSNAADDDDVQTLVKNAGLRPFFDFVLSSAACRVRKPNPYIFQLALQNWGLPADKAVMIGDTLGADILGARNAGLYSIWLTRHTDTPGNRDHLDTIRPDLEATSLADIPGLIKSL